MIAEAEREKNEAIVSDAEQMKQATNKNDEERQMLLERKRKKVKEKRSWCGDEVGDGGKKRTEKRRARKNLGEVRKAWEGWDGWATGKERRPRKSRPIKQQVFRVCEWL